MPWIFEAVTSQRPDDSEFPAVRIGKSEQLPHPWTSINQAQGDHVTITIPLAEAYGFQLHGI